MFSFTLNYIKWPIFQKYFDFYWKQIRLLKVNFEKKAGKKSLKVANIDFTPLSLCFFLIKIVKADFQHKFQRHVLYQFSPSLCFLYQFWPEDAKKIVSILATALHPESILATRREKKMQNVSILDNLQVLRLHKM